MAEQVNPLRKYVTGGDEQAGGEQPPATDMQIDIEGDPDTIGRIRDTVTDLGRGVLGGVRDGLQETGETIQQVGEGAWDYATGGSDLYYTTGGDGFEWLTEEEVAQRDDIWGPEDARLFGDNGMANLPEVEENETVAGGMVRGVSQFLTGYAAAGRALQIGRGATALGSFGRASAQGAVADAVSFDAHEERFSDFLRDQTGLRDPITEFLSADEDDTVLEGKLKNALEGFGLGAATDGILYLTKSFKRARSIRAEQGDEAAAEFMNEQIANAPEEAQLSLFDETTDPNLSTTGADPEVRVTDASGRARDADAPADAQPRERATTETEQEIRLRQQREREARPDFDPTSFNEAITREIGMVRAGSLPDPNATLRNDFFNWDKMDSEYTTKQFVEMAADAVPREAIQDTKTFQIMEREAMDFLADSIDGSPEEIRSYLRRTAKDAEKQQAALLGGKMLMQSIGREIEQLAYKISNGAATDTDYGKMVRLQATALEMAADVKSIQKSAAQTTAAGRVHTTDAVTGEQISRIDIIRQLEDEIGHAGGKDKIRDLADEIMAKKRSGGGTTGVMNVTVNRAKGGMDRFFQVANEVRINGLLSGPRTHMINMLSNGFQMGLLPMEKIAGGALKLDASIMREGFAQYMGIARALEDSFKASAAAGWRGRNILDPEAAILEANGVDYRAIQSHSDRPVWDGIVNWTGKTIRLPSRALTVGDELFKQLNYRSHLYARLSRQAADLVQQGRVKPEDAAKWVDDRLKAGIGADGRARDAAALQHAREATFTNELRQGSFPRKVQNWTNQHPWAKIIVPFVRTPTNIIVAGGQRTPLIRRLSKNLADDLKSGDPSRVAAARGKLVTGNIMWGTAIMAALNDKITGSGPVDPAARKRLMETGWRPYSYKRTKADGSTEYVEFNRLDPFAMFFGIAADVAEIGGQVDDATYGELAKAALVAFANNVGSKTYLQGITDAANAYANPDMHMEHYLQSLAASFMPYSSASREARKADDPYMREVEGYLAAIKNQIPGYSETLPARRSMITGEPVVYPKGWGDEIVTPIGEAMASMNPIYARDDKQDMVLQELADLGEGVTGYPNRKMDGVELTPKQYSRYVELHGIVRPSTTKRSLYQELERLFKSPSYDRERQRVPEVSDSALDPRLTPVRKIITGYRELAKQELLREFPDLREKVVKNRSEMLRNQRMLTTGVSAITELGN